MSLRRALLVGIPARACHQRYLTHRFAAETSKILHDQLEALSALASRMLWNDKSAAHDSTWESIIVNAFGGSSDSEETTLGSEVQQAGYMGVKGALEEVRHPSISYMPELILVLDDIRRSTPFNPRYHAGQRILIRSSRKACLRCRGHP